jgi:hypothetical protein
MKKTIAILLVLVIGMVGVWADTTNLYLSTTVPLVNQMVVAPTTAILASYTWPSENGASNLLDDGATADDAFPVTSALEAELTTIAQLFARSNSRAGVAISLEATKLFDDTAYTATVTDDSLNIDYSIEVGGAAISFVNGEKDGTPTYAIGSLAYNETGIDQKAWDIKVKLDESLANAAAGTYDAYITFTFTAAV